LILPFDVGGLETVNLHRRSKVGASYVSPSLDGVDAEVIRAKRVFLDRKTQSWPQEMI
jgi:hypothetical protein